MHVLSIIFILLYVEKVNIPGNERRVHPIPLVIPEGRRVADIGVTVHATVGTCVVKTDVVTFVATARFPGRPLGVNVRNLKNLAQIRRVNAASLFHPIHRTQFVQTA